MTILKSVHHINFIVADLDRAVERYRKILGLESFEFEELPERGVATARVQIGDVWLVLVCPRRAGTVADKYLEEHGEGFFLLSFGVDDLDQAMTHFASRGIIPADSEARLGIMDWRVADLDSRGILGVNLHLTELE